MFIVTTLLAKITTERKKMLQCKKKANFRAPALKLGLGFLVDCLKPALGWIAPESCPPSFRQLVHRPIEKAACLNGRRKECDLTALHSFENLKCTGSGLPVCCSRTKTNLLKFDVFQSMSLSPQMLSTIDSKRGAESVYSLGQSSTITNDDCGGQYSKGEFELTVNDDKSTRKERRAIRGEIRKCALKLLRKGANTKSSHETASALKAAGLLSQVWNSGVGYRVAIELVRDALAEQEEEARILGVDPSDVSSIDRTIFSTKPRSNRNRNRRAPSPAPFLDDAVLSLLLSCSFRILRRLKHREPRWDRSAIRRAFHRLGQVWARGLSSLGHATPSL